MRLKFWHRTPPSRCIPQPPSRYIPQPSSRRISKEVKKTVFMRDGTRCKNCGLSDTRCMAETGEHLHFDHIKPFSSGGPNTVSNIQLLCPACNLRKSNRWDVTTVVLPNPTPRATYLLAQLRDLDLSKRVLENMAYLNERR